MSKRSKDAAPTLDQVRESYRKSLQEIRLELEALEDRLESLHDPSNAEISALSQVRQCKLARMDIATKIYEMDRLQPLTAKADRLAASAKRSSRTRRSDRVSAPTKADS